MLVHLVVLLDRVGSHRHAALLAGAVFASRERHPKMPPDEARLEEALGRVRNRLGRRPTDDALAEGAAPSYADAVVHARRAISSASQANTEWHSWRRPRRSPDLPMCGRLGAGTTDRSRSPKGSSGSHGVA